MLRGYGFFLLSYKDEKYTMYIEHIIFLGLRTLFCGSELELPVFIITVARSLLYTPLAAASKSFLFLFWVWFWDRNQLPQILSLLPQPSKCQYHWCVLPDHVQGSRFSSLRCWSSCIWLWSMSSMDMEWCLTVVLIFRAFLANDVDYPPFCFCCLFFVVVYTTVCSYAWPNFKILE